MRRVVRKLLRLAGRLALLVPIVLALALALAQTPPAKAWLADVLGRALSDAEERVTLTHLTGFVPFDIAIDKIEIADAQGPRIVVDRAALALAPGDLLAGRLTVTRLSAEIVDVARPGHGGTDLAAPLHPTLAASVEHATIDVLSLGPDVAGEPIIATATGSLRLDSGRAAADLDIHRIDGAPGRATLHAALSGAPLRLELAGDIAEPTGHLLADFLGRPQPLPLAVHLAGSGELADWHGTLTATAGSDATLDADFHIAGASNHHLAATGSARVASLLPPRLQGLAGERASFSAALTVDDDVLTLDELTLTAVAGRVAAQGRFDRRGQIVGGQASLELPDIAVLAPFIGDGNSGGLAVSLALGGAWKDLQARLTLAGDRLSLAGNAARQGHATVDLHGLGDPLSAATGIAIAASGDAEGVTVPSASLPGWLGDRLDWQVAARLDRQAERVDIEAFALRDAGNTLAARAAATRDSIAGDARLDLPDIAPFAPGSAGALALDAAFRLAGDGGAAAVLNGVVRGPKSGISAIDRLLGDRAAVTGTIRRLADGTLSADEISLDGAQLHATGAARRGSDGMLAIDYRLALPRLAALDRDLAGSATLTGTLSGAIDRLSASAVLDAEAIAAGPVHFDHVDARLSLIDLAHPSGRLDATFRDKSLAGAARIDGALGADDVLRLARIHVEAAGSRLDGALALHLATGLVDGSLAGEAPALQPWSELLGASLAGSAQAKAAFVAGKGQSVDVTLDGRELRAGDTAAQHLHATAQLGDILGKPTGKAALQLDDATAGGAVVTTLRLDGESDRPGRFSLRGNARGTAGQTFTLTAAATMSVGDRSIELGMTKLDGGIGDLTVALHRPLLLTRRGTDLAVADLDLGLGAGTISGAGSTKGNALSAHLLAKNLPVHTLAEIGGQKDLSGVLGFEATLGGNRAAPEGRLIVDGEELRLAAASRPDLPPLGLVIEADWRGAVATVKGRLAGPQHAALGFTGSVPLTLDAARLIPHVPPQGALALRLEGEGDLAHLADLLPIGEDRLAGRFAIDLSVAGTVAAPQASGRLTVRDGHYESSFWGTALNGVAFDLVGANDRLLLKDFTGGDGDKGKIALQGAVDLAAAGGPVFDVAGTFTSFRAVQRDEATAVVSGDISLGGNIAAPRLGARLTIEQAELRVPERLPQTLRPIAATIIDGATGKVLSRPEQDAAPAAWLALALEVTVDMPGQVFVRGRGLDSEWRGRLRVTGTTAAPAVDGKLEVVRGTYAFIGKTATLSRGTIAFIGGAHIDPEIDIEGRVSSPAVVAVVTIAGTATQPSIHLASEPPLPQDEILARVLFGTTVSKIGAGQAFEIAQAGAALATGGDPGVLDRIRSGLGLDRLSLGAASANTPYGGVAMPSTPAGVPSAFPTGSAGSSSAPLGAASGSTGLGATAVSAGKYVAEGVYVGVSQGLGAGSSSVDVQVDVTRHISIDTSAGQASGAGVGVNWKLDY
jgi:translocation and assembly module TamB